MELVTDPREIERLKLLDSGSVYSPITSQKEVSSEEGQGWGIGEGNPLLAGVKRGWANIGNAFAANDEQTERELGIDPNRSRYAKRVAALYSQESKEEQEKLGTAGQLISGVTQFAPAIGLGLVNPYAGGIAAGSTVYGDSLTTQADEGKEYDLNRARIAGIGSGIIDAATGGLGSKLLPIGSSVARRVATNAAEDAGTGVGMQVGMNYGADHDLDENLAAAAAFGAGGGAVIRGGVKAAKSGYDKFKGSNDGGLPVPSVTDPMLPSPDSNLKMNPNFESNLSSYIERTTDLRNKIETDPVNRNQHIEDLNNLALSNSGDAAVAEASARLSDSNVPITNTGLNYNYGDDFLHAEGSKNAGSQFGLEVRGMIKTGKIKEDARMADFPGRRTDSQTKGLTKESNAKQVVVEGDHHLKNLIGAFDENYAFARKRYAEVKNDPSIPQATKNLYKDLETHTSNLQKEAANYASAKKKEQSSSLELDAKQAMKIASELGEFHNLVGLDRTPNTFNPIHDIRVIAMTERTLRSEVPTFHEKNADLSKERTKTLTAGLTPAGLMLDAASVATGLGTTLVPLRHIAKGSGEIYHAVRSQKKLEAELRKGKQSAKEIATLRGKVQRAADAKLASTLEKGDIDAAANHSTSSLELDGIHIPEQMDVPLNKPKDEFADNLSANRDASLERRAAYLEQLAAEQEAKGAFDGDIKEAITNRDKARTLRYAKTAKKPVTEIVEPTVVIDESYKDTQDLASAKAQRPIKEEEVIQDYADEIPETPIIDKTTQDLATSKRSEIDKVVKPYVITGKDGSHLVKILRNKDGSATIMFGKGSFEYNKSFVNGKTDSELLKYAFENEGITHIDGTEVDKVGDKTENIEEPIKKENTSQELIKKPTQLEQLRSGLLNLKATPRNSSELSKNIKIIESQINHYDHALDILKREGTPEEIHQAIKDLGGIHKLTDKYGINNGPEIQREIKGQLAENRADAKVRLKEAEEAKAVEDAKSKQEANNKVSDLDESVKEEKLKIEIAKGEEKLSLFKAENKALGIDEKDIESAIKSAYDESGVFRKTVATNSLKSTLKAKKDSLNTSESKAPPSKNVNSIENTRQVLRDYAEKIGLSDDKSVQDLITSKTRSVPNVHNAGLSVKETRNIMNKMHKTLQDKVNSEAEILRRDEIAYSNWMKKHPNNTNPVEEAHMARVLTKHRAGVAELKRKLEESKRIKAQEEARIANEANNKVKQDAKDKLILELDAKIKKLELEKDTPKTDLESFTEEVDATNKIVSSQAKSLTPVELEALASNVEGKIGESGSTNEQLGSVVGTLKALSSAKVGVGYEAAFNKLAEVIQKGVERRIKYPDLPETWISYEDVQSVSKLRFPDTMSGYVGNIRQRLTNAIQREHKNDKQLLNDAQIEATLKDKDNGVLDSEMKRIEAHEKRNDIREILRKEPKKLKNKGKGKLYVG